MSYQGVHQLLEELKLHGIQQQIDAQIEQWTKEGKDVLSLMHNLLLKEKEYRQVKGITYRVKRAGFPAPKTLESFDFSFQPSIDQKQIRNLSTLKFLYNHENVLFLGPSGSGKSHLATALGMRVAEEGKKPFFINSINLVDRLKTAFKNYRLDSTMKFYRSVDLLIIDELGYLPLDMEGAKLLFELISSRYEKGSIIITSNRSFSDWDKIFSDSVIATAILDRLLHHSHIVNIRGKSYRLREKQKSGLWEGGGGVPPHKNIGEPSQF